MSISRRTRKRFNYQISEQDLINLGFEEDELEVFNEMGGDNYILIDLYLDIARSPPYNQNWNNIGDALNAPPNLNVVSQFGIPYTKRDIASIAFSRATSMMEGGIKKRKKVRKNRTKSKFKKYKKYNKTKKFLSIK